MDVKAYCRKPNGELIGFNVTNVEQTVNDIADAIKCVEDTLNESDIAYKKPILCLITGGSA